jgi:hypothetical protein
LFLDRDVPDLRVAHGRDESGSRGRVPGAWPHRRS